MKAWVGSEHCEFRVHCANCLGTGEYSADWRWKMRNPQPVLRFDSKAGWLIEAQNEGFDMLPEDKLVCPYGVTLQQALAGQANRGADVFINNFAPFLARLSEADKADVIVQCVSENRLTEEVALKAAVKLGLSLDAEAKE